MPPVRCSPLHDGHPVLAVHGRVGQADHTPLSAFLDMVAPLGAPCMTRTVGLDIIIEAFTPDGRPLPDHTGDRRRLAGPSP